MYRGLFPGQYEQYLLGYLGKKENRGKTEVDFVEHQLKTLTDNLRKLESQTNIQTSNSKINIREKNINDTKGLIKYYNLKLESLPNRKTATSIDLSDSKGTEKIIMLKFLGVFDFLKNKEPFNTSKNSLASAISGITGIKVTTVQSYINPIDNPSVDQSNNPLDNERAKTNVINKLSNIGYNISD